MKVIWKLSTGLEECPRCDSALMSIDGKNQICPPCSAIEIKRLKKLLAELRATIRREKEMPWIASASHGDRKQER